MAKEVNKQNPKYCPPKKARSRADLASAALKILEGE